MAVRDDFAAGEVLAAADLNDTFASKLTYPAGGNDGDLLAKDGTDAQWIAVPEAGLEFVETDTFSAVSSVSLSSVFEADTNYRLVIKSTHSAGGQAVYFRMRTGITDSSASYYSTIPYGIYSANSLNNDLRQNNGSFFWFGNGASFLLSVDFYKPNTAAITNVFAHLASAVETGAGGGYHNVATAYDGITFFPGSGTISGEYFLYKYRMA